MSIDVKRRIHLWCIILFIYYKYIYIIYIDINYIHTFIILSPHHLNGILLFFLCKAFAKGFCDWINDAMYTQVLFWQKQFCDYLAAILVLFLLRQQMSFILMISSKSGTFPFTWQKKEFILSIRTCQTLMSTRLKLTLSHSSVWLQSSIIYFTDACDV